MCLTRFLRPRLFPTSLLPLTRRDHFKKDARRHVRYPRVRLHALCQTRRERYGRGNAPRMRRRTGNTRGGRRGRARLRTLRPRHVGHSHVREPPRMQLALRNAVYRVRHVRMDAEVQNAPEEGRSTQRQPDEATMGGDGAWSIRYQPHRRVGPLPAHKEVGRR